MKAMLIDISRCNGCYNCQIACKDEHVDNEWPPYKKAQPDTGQFWMRLTEIERGTYPKVKIAYIAQPCMHCDDPACMKASQNGAVHKRNDGIVSIDPVKSEGQKKIVDACPFGSIYWNEELSIPQKCDFCAHLLDQGWKEPRCVEACPTAALKFGDYDELKGLIAEKKAVQLKPEKAKKTSVFYAGLPKRFVAGAVFTDDTDEPLENAEILLTDLKTKDSIRRKTDNYGDFEFEGLEINGTYSILVSKKGYSPGKVDSIVTEKDVYIGKIQLSQAK